MSATRRVAKQPGWFSRLALDHTRALSATLLELRARPLGTLLTAFVIGITLALPAGLHAVLRNLDGLGGGAEASLRASLFLKDAVDAEAGQQLAKRLARRAGVGEAHYVSREQGLAEFKAHSGFGEALDILKDNPLPAVIVVTPDRHQPQAQADALMKELAALPEVETAKLDLEWLKRLYAILALVQRGVLLIAGLLAAAVLVVIGNTIRLDIASRREEILVLKLIGASNAFIRRPFLYTGLCYGLAGAVLACLLVVAAAYALAEPAGQLAGLYGDPMSLHSLSFEAVLGVFAAGILLGWFGAFWTVSQHLSGIEPD
ncbi:MAG: permease-like cell division protein FtsX [Nevskia sp.]